MTTNDWCRAIGIEAPKLESVATHREANTYSLLLVALLERGQPMTLPEVAARFAKAGIADETKALRSLQRCQPSRPPVYREGEHYHLDPYDCDLALWLFRLGIVPAKIGPSSSPEEARIARKRREEAEIAELAAMSRALLVAFPKEAPQVVALVDIGKHEITTFAGGELSTLRARLESYDIIGAIDVRTILRGLAFHPGQKRLAELRPVQKSSKLGPHGGSLTITAALLVEGSCGIKKPFSDPKKLAGYLEKGELSKLRRCLEADAKSLYAFYEYGRLQGTVRLRWGPIDEDFQAPWSLPAEPRLHRLIRSAYAMGVPLEVVVGKAPPWDDEKAGAQLARVVKDADGWTLLLIDENRFLIEEADVQRAWLPIPIH